MWVCCYQFWVTTTVINRDFISCLIHRDSDISMAFKTFKKVAHIRKSLEQYCLQWCNLACDWFAAGLTLLGIKAAKALEAVRAVVSGGEVLTRQLCLTAGAHKTLLMPWLIPIGHTTFSQSLKRKVIPFFFFVCRTVVCMFSNLNIIMPFFINLVCSISIHQLKCSPGIMRNSVK